jgi:hypothetical protein
LTIDGVAPNTLPLEWHDLVHDHAKDKKTFNRRQLEVVAILELTTAIKAGEVFVCGSLSFDRFWDRLPTEAADPAAVAAYATARGWADGADGLVRALKRALDQKASFLGSSGESVGSFICMSRPPWTRHLSTGQACGQPLRGA